MTRPFCFVLMPFGKKPNAAGSEIDFDAVYSNLIAPAIEEADLEPIRADHEVVGGLIHKPMYERLVLCEYAVADLTTANANVFYELGLRHAARPCSTILLFSKDGKQLPFDVGPLRAIPYELHADGTPANIDPTKAALVKSLREARKAAAEGPIPDSPVFHLVEGYPSDIAHAKTDIFREQVQYSAEKKRALALARQQGVEALRACARQLGSLADIEAGVVIDLFLSYRAVSAWEDMSALVDKMPRPLAATAMVQEQLALALNRAGHGEEAEKVLTDLIARRGPSSETYGILGRVYKDRWEAAAKRSETFLARGLLDKAIDAYLRGFEADWRDAYPGVNTVTLMELKEPPDPRRAQLLPVVTYAVERRIASGKPDYWDHATRLELAVLAKDEPKAMEALGNALAAVREAWEPETTARNLRLIREARERRQEAVPWAKEVEEALEHPGKR
jgi:tetratricopeptide (TPR) repeat protein